ncbi:ParA family protein [Catellatospora sp. NPDC049133]|uniref:ParA family protein n=1 Tax=Catellatospora sp. NPDC049133 TaxID=3155499 RepID=UPI0033D733EC
MAFKVATANRSGGCGKTTTLTSIAALANNDMLEWIKQGWTIRGRKPRILIIDLDGQCDSSYYLGVADPDSLCMVCGERFDDELEPKERQPEDMCDGGRWHEPIPNIMDVLSADTSIREAIRATNLELVDLLPGTKHLEAAEKNLASATGAEFRLMDAVAEIEDEYDLILFDSPASYGLIAVNIFMATDDVIACVKAGMKEIRALVHLEHTIKQINTKLKHRVRPRATKIVAVLVTDAPGSVNHGKAYQDAVNFARDEYGELVVTPVTRDVRVIEAYSARQPVPLYDPSSNAAKAFGKVYPELIGKGVLPSQRTAAGV